MKKSLGPHTIVHPTPVFVVGTYDKNNKPNVMTVAWAGICCSIPPCVSISLRKATYTYECLMQRKAFTISIPSEDYVKEADFFGMVSGQTTDKFTATGLTPEKSTLVDAPFVKEFPLILECKLVHHVELGLHTLFVGEVLDVKAEESVLGPTNATDVKKVRPLAFAPDSQGYYGIGEFIGHAFSIGEALGKDA
jgi:flavin reductase (DIM6/NTAB) family NADH-FMN oxidoreductase RutF